MTTGNRALDPAVDSKGFRREKWFGCEPNQRGGLMLCKCSRCGTPREGNEMFLDQHNRLLCYHPSRGEDCYQITQEEENGD
jgi:hypothetical protein